MKHLDLFQIDLARCQNQLNSFKQSLDQFAPTQLRERQDEKIQLAARPSRRRFPTRPVRDVRRALRCPELEAHDFPRMEWAPKRGRDLDGISETKVRWKKTQNRVEMSYRIAVDDYFPAETAVVNLGITRGSSGFPHQTGPLSDCRPWESNAHGRCRPEDFKSSVSAANVALD